MPYTAKRLATAVILLASTSAQTVQESISFGHSQNIAPNGQTIPNWKYVGEGHTPYLLSDRINLTPPVIGNTRGGLWAEKELSVPEWVLDLSFRVSGPERGSGNMQVWLTKDTTPASSMKSLYTVDKFDGLVIVLDQYQGTGGSIRGFLNDGSVDFRTHHNVDGLAFGHCEYVYRNLGRMSKLSMKHDSQGLEVKVDDKLCFKSNIVCIGRFHHVELLINRCDRSKSQVVITLVSRQRPQKRPILSSSTNSLSLRLVHLQLQAVKGQQTSHPMTLRQHQYILGVTNPVFQKRARLITPLS